MTNGRSGGFLIRKSDLEELLNRLAEGAVAGYTVASLIKERSSPSHTAEGCDRATLNEMLKAFDGKQVWVEEQDSKVYVLHLDWEVQVERDPDPQKWILIKPGSPLFAALRERHKHISVDRVFAKLSLWLRRNQPRAAPDADGKN